MSYTIVYDKRFLKIDDKIIPLVLSGSNNCWEGTYGGRQRRVRDWNTLYGGRNSNIAYPVEVLMEKVKGMCGCSCEEHFMQNGKWVDDAGLIRFVENGIKHAKTIEEMKETYYFGDMYGYFSVWDKSDNHMENYVEVFTSEDVRQFLMDVDERLARRVEGEEIYFCLRYHDEKFRMREKQIRTPKERLSNYYAIRVNECGYLTKVTRSKLRYTSLCGLTKQFKTEKQAIRYMEKLKDRFASELRVEYVSE